MTVSELANKLNITVSQVFEFYEEIRVDIPQDENYVLTVEQIKRALSNYKTEEDLENTESQTEPKSATTRRKDVVSPEEKLRAKRIKIFDDFEPFFNKGNKILLKEFKKHNSIPDFLLEGDFRKVEGKGFGFFKNITHQNGNALTYPISYDLVDNIFIATNELTNGKRYSFEVKIANRQERRKRTNPFLLQAKNENIKEMIELDAINQQLKAKQEDLEEIKADLEEAEEDFEEKKSEIEEKLSKLLEEEQAKANSTIETYQEILNQKFNEIQNKEKELTFLDETVKTTNTQLQKMENLLSTLKNRISLCRNLQFINEEDENRYLNLLTAKKYNPENHFDFEEDFENNFFKLSEYIHSYLFHKRNLIYTKFQIKNFLTLLRTNDLVILSGLSGSGKTQIVKAFAEALGGIAKVIPVKPNWTSSDDLIGYYNPIQMSFLPTPFTEAIVEAINNPNQLYFICLDEMNLARVEYYFADFLSKLEERSKQPEIELYANHEEELFVSEFNTLLNFIESSTQGKEIKSWQDFLNDEEARNKFFELLGNTDKESMLQLHSKMKRRLIDILKFPSTIKIPNNVRFIGAINVDETTNYFSPKILDRVHIVQFDNPLLFEEQVNNSFENTENESENVLLPVYVQPDLLSKRNEYPNMNNEELLEITAKLKEINKEFLLPLNIDFGIRSIRQAINYFSLVSSVFPAYFHDFENYDMFGSSADEWDYYDDEHNNRIFKIALNTIMIQKIFPRFMFDGNETAKNGESKIQVVESFQKFLANEFDNYYFDQYNETYFGKICSDYLMEMIIQAKRNDSQFNFFG